MAKKRNWHLKTIKNDLINRNDFILIKKVVENIEVIWNS